MSVKTCLRVIPAIVKQFNSEHIFIQSRKLFNCARNLRYTHNLTNSLHVRYLASGASKNENIKSERHRVYYGVLTPQIRAVKWFSLTTSVFGVICQPFLYNELSAMQNFPLIVAGCTFVGFFTFVTPLLLHYVTKKYVTYLDYIPDKQTYVATTINFFCMLRETKFTPDDVKVPDVPGMFTTLIAKGKPMFLDARQFEDPSHYAKIMGYDKPIDFKMFESSEDEKK